MVILSHPTGNQFVRYAASGLIQAQMLQSFYTSIACFENDFLYKIGRFSKLAELRKRVFDSDLKPFTNTNPYHELMRQLSMKMNWESLIKHEFGKFSIDGVYANHDYWVSKKIRQQQFNGAKAIYAYEDAAIQSFIKSKQIGLTNFYDLSIGYWRMGSQILAIEKERQPLYASTLTGLLNSDNKLAKKDEELALADNIIVASSFTKNTLNLYPNSLNKVTVIPYGFPEVEARNPFKEKTNKPLKLLFVGGLTQRKGIAEVFETANYFGKHTELTIIGRKTSNECKELDNNLKKYNWIPSLPHHDILEQMRQHDILLFPSLFEGFGMVISEAMSQGMPVITTNHTAGKDFITHGENGWIVEPGNSNAMIHVIQNIIDNREQLEQIKINAQNTAKERPWHKYATELALFVKQNLGND
jgi:glycosyltransferase involved in cell wall biosynthesis